MIHKVQSIRPFIGSENFDQSRSFYKELGFKEYAISENLCYFKISDDKGFYLQDYYVEQWINNSMIFIHVENAEYYYQELEKLELDLKYVNVKLSTIKNYDWGRECFLHDPSGVLWHFGEFYD